MNTRTLTRTALFAALTAAGAFIRIPLGYSSITLQFFFTAMAGCLLGPVWGPVSQAVYVALNRPRSAVFFSLLRKAVIVVPLTLALPHFFGLGVNGVFLAEPISNYIGGAACYITMLLTVWRDLKKADVEAQAAQ